MDFEQDEAVSLDSEEALAAEGRFDTGADAADGGDTTDVDGVDSTPQDVVYPSTVAHLPGVTARPTIADAATAARLVASRAFTYDAPTVADGEEPPVVEVVQFDPAERAALDVWVSPVPHGEHYIR